MKHLLFTSNTDTFNSRSSQNQDKDKQHVKPYPSNTPSTTILYPSEPHFSVNWIPLTEQTTWAIVHSSIL